MKRIILLSGVLSLVSSGIFALDINVVPGKLSDSGTVIKNTKDDRLVLKGEAYATDLEILKQLPSTVHYLDMSGLSLKAENGISPQYFGRTDFADNELPPYMLMGTTLKSVTLPEQTKIIGASAFAGSMIESITIPASVNVIGDYAFADCVLLKSVKLTNETSFGKGVFKNCRSLADMSYGFEIKEIPAYMFDGCSYLAQDIPSSVKTVGGYAYRGTKIRNLDLRNVEVIGDYAFASMPELESIVFDADADLKFGKGAFFGDLSLSGTSEFYGDLPSLLFARSGKLTHPKINSSVIGEASFAGAPEITAVTLGSNVKKIEANAFRNLNGLTVVSVADLGSAIPEVSDEAFSGLQNESGRYDINLNVEKGTNDQWQAHPVWGLFNIGQFDVSTSDAPYVGDVSVSATRRNGDVSVVSSLPIDYIGVFSIDGSVLHESNPARTEYNVSGIGSRDVIIVKIVSGGLVKVLRLL